MSPVPMPAAAEALASAVLLLCVLEDGSAAWADALAAAHAVLASCDHAGDPFTTALAEAARELCACAWNSDAWADARAAFADVLGQGGLLDLLVSPPQLLVYACNGVGNGPYPALRQRLWFLCPRPRPHGLAPPLSRWHAPFLPPQATRT